MRFEEFLRRVPKAELHCHFEGALRSATVLDLARRHGMVAPEGITPEGYVYERSDEFFEMFGFIAGVMNNEEDYARCVYETVEDGVRTSNLRYREMFFNPTLHARQGVSMATMLDGLATGIEAAAHDFGVRVCLIADVYRSDTGRDARQMVEELLAHRIDALIGIGMDGEEAPDPPEKFVDAFRLAARGGLHRTAHASEDAPPVNITTCLDLLGCERIDHGYYVLDDASLLRRVLDEGIAFTTCLTTTIKAYFSPVVADHPIPAMLAAGLLVSLNADDPTMVATDLGDEYVRLCGPMDYGPDVVRRLSLAGIDSSWLDPVDKQAMRREFSAALDALEAQLTAVA